MLTDRRRRPRRNSDRRNYNRIYSAINASIRVDEQVFYTTIENVSAYGGLIVDKSQNKLAATQICKITIPDEEREIELETMVIWVKDIFAGLSFINVNQANRDLLDELLQRKIRESISAEGMKAFA